MTRPPEPLAVGSVVMDSSRLVAGARTAWVRVSADPFRCWREVTNYYDESACMWSWDELGDPIWIIRDGAGDAQGD